jgi:ubiquinone biosynthesis protein COQ4
MNRANAAPRAPENPMETSLQFRTAWQALGRLRQNPDATEEVFVIIRALTGKSGERQFERFRRTETGGRILAEKRDLLSVLQDRAYLESLPEGSLGREYAAFTAREQISAEGLVDASNPVEREVLEEDRARFFDQLRDSHDLQHVVSGWGRDLSGEISLLAFGIAQAWNHGIGLIVGHVYWSGDANTREMIRRAWRRGKKAQWLAAADWTLLLPRPLDEIRAEFEMGDTPVYEPVWSAGAPAAAA